MNKKSFFKNKTILVTGGTGSFGKAFTKYVIDQKLGLKKLIIFSRDELKQFEMNKNFSDSKYEFIRYFIGDIRDKDRLKLAFKDVDIVVHAAALKQVPAAEYNPIEFIKTNVFGSQNIIETAIDSGVKKVVALSTDKASSPINLYGATKLCADKLFISSNNYYGMERKTKISIVRYGNVMGSRGSVIPFFKNYNRSKDIPITDTRMTRFNLTISEGVEFVLSNLDKMLGSEIFIPKIKSYKILDLLESIRPDAKYKVVGIRNGEKLHEEMISKDDARNTIEFDKFYIIYPSNIFNDKKYISFIKKFSGKKTKKDFSYSSDNNEFLSINQIRKYLKSDN